MDFLFKPVTEETKKIFPEIKFSEFEEGMKLTFCDKIRNFGCYGEQKYLYFRHYANDRVYWMVNVDNKFWLDILFKAFYEKKKVHFAATVCRDDMHLKVHYFHVFNEDLKE